MIGVVVVKREPEHDENVYGTTVYRLEFETEQQCEAWLESATSRPYSATEKNRLVPM